jgi:hypothetical protein
MAKQNKKVTARILQGAIDLIAKPGGWTRGHLASNKSRTQFFAPEDTRATCFCAMGAIMRSAGRAASSYATQALVAQIGHPGIGFWNDEQPSKKPVLAAFRKALLSLGVGA